MHGRKNIAWGFLFLGAFMAIGFFLGYMHDVAPQREQWIADFASGLHFETRVSHVHGSLFGLINVAIGLVLLKLPVPERTARWTSWLGLAGLLMPLGTLLHALLGVPPALVLIGGLSMIVATVWLGLAAFGLRRAE